MKLLTILLSLFSDKAADKITNQIKIGISPLAPYLRRISTGVVLILLSIIAWFAGLIFALVSLFVYLSNLHQFVAPALFTTLACFVVGVLLILIGFSMVKKPK